MDETIVNPVPVIEEQATTEEVTEVVPVKPGEKTDSAQLLESLKEEREKRRRAEALAAERESEIQSLKSQPEMEVFSDEGKMLLTKISKLESQLMSREEKEILNQVQSKFPQIKDKSEEFKQFQEENPGMKLETAAKAFLVENNLYETPHVRKGLEKASGGGRVEVKTGLSAEDIDTLRLNNPRKFRDMLKSGQIKN